MMSALGKLASLTLVILCVIWLMHELNTKNNIASTTPIVRPDVYMENVTTLQMDASGLPESRYHSPEMVHYPNTGATDLTAPDLYVYVAGHPAWHITAKQGRAEKGANVINLWDQVRAHQPPSANNAPTTILTSKATIYPAKKIVETLVEVTLIQPGTTVKSLGARANMQTNEIELLSNARASYRKQQP